jgi:hypothetical protein
MFPWKKILLVITILLLDIGAALYLAVWLMDYGHVPPFKDEAFEQYKREVDAWCRVWSLVNLALLSLLLYSVIKFVKQRMTARHHLPRV